MAHEIPPQFRSVVNSREIPAHRAERLWALHGELSTPQGLRHSAFWLPSAWPHLLQLVSDPHPEVRAAVAQVLGHLGAVLAGRREPSLAGRMPPSALMDWGLAMLSPASTLPAAQCMTTDAKESALTALHVCIAAMPPSDVAPYAQPLLRLTMALLEATTTPPCLLGPLLRLLLAALPTVPLAVLGHGFGDLADLLCGWALEPLVASTDRQLITLILHALRPQWHSHPDLTASLTDNMLIDIKVATAAAAAEGGAAAASQAAACIRLVQLLCDIFSAASLRKLSLVSPDSVLEEPVRSFQGHAMRPEDPAQQMEATTSMQQPTRVVLARGQHIAPTAGQNSNLANQQQQLTQGEVQLVKQQGQQRVLPLAYVPTNACAHAAGALPRLHAPRPLALTAILPTRPSAATVRHLVGLYPRFLATLTEVGSSLIRLGIVVDAPVSLKASPDGAEAMVSRLCSCVETLVDSVASCVKGIDPRDVDEVWEGFNDSIMRRLAAMTLREGGHFSIADNAVVRTDITAAAKSSLFPDVASGGYGPVGAVAAAAAPKAVDSIRNMGAAGAYGTPRWGSADRGGDGGGVAQANADLRSGQPVSGMLDRSATLRLWALQTALEWALSLLSRAVGGEEGASSMRPTPGADAEALLDCAVRLVNKAMEQDANGAGPLLLGLVLEGPGGSIDVCGLRSSPRTSSVAAAAKLLQALLSLDHPGLAAATLCWLLADLRRCLVALQLGVALPAPLQASLQPLQSSLPMVPGAQRGVEDASASTVGAVAFDCAVLQAACQRGWLGFTSLLRVEAATWGALYGTTPSLGLQAPLVPVPVPAAQGSGTIQASGPSDDARIREGQVVSVAQDTTGTSEPASMVPKQSQRSDSLPLSAIKALCDAWAAAAAALIAAVYKGRWLAPAGVAAASRANAGIQLGALPETVSATAAQDAAPAAFAAARACCAAYLHAIHTIRAGLMVSGNRAGIGTSLELCVLTALRYLLKQTVVAGSGVLRCEKLFRLAVEAVSVGATIWDARVRTAAVDCAMELVAHVLQPLRQPTPTVALAATASSTSAAGGGVDGSMNAEAVALPPPRPEAFTPLVALALSSMADPSPDVATAAARLASDLSEAALLAVLHGPASYCTWVPDWQDSLAVTPAKHAPRMQQVARLLELVFQSAAPQGSVLLRKRSPATSAAGPGASDDGDAWGRLEALQRLALGMLRAEASMQTAPAAGGVAGGAAASSNSSRLSAAVPGETDSSAASAEDRSNAALVWLAVQEGAKHMVAARLRTHLGGPTQTLGALERMLQMTYSRLSQERRDTGPMDVGAAGRESAWLVLELVGALERAVVHAAEGYVGRDALLQPVLAFFAANKKVCEEWFIRGRELLARIAALVSAHHHAAHHGLLRLRDMRGTMRQLLASLAKERSKAAAAAAAAQTDAKGDGTGAGGDGAQAAAVGTAAVAAAGGSASADVPSQASQTAARQGSKQLQRRGGAGGDAALPGHQPQQLYQHSPTGAPAAATVAAGGGAQSAAMGEEAAVAPSPVNQLESNLSRLAAAVVEVLKLVGSALLAMGEVDSLQGLHTWAAREFEPLLQGAHLQGASAVAAATAAAAADALASDESGLGAAGPGNSRRRPEPTRAARSGSGSKQQKDPFAWLLGLSLQAAGSYEQALLSYNVFLAPAQAPAAHTITGSPGNSNAAAVPTPSPNTALELAAAAQSFVVGRVAECYAALTDWSGLQGLMRAFSHTATTEPAVASWWPAAAASIEHKFRALEALDTAAFPVAASDPVPDHVLLNALRALEEAAAATVLRAAPSGGSVAPPPPQPQPHEQGLAVVREATSLELSRLLDRLRFSALSEPVNQRQLLLQASCLRNALRALDAELAAKGGGDGSADGPWRGLLLPQALPSTSPAEVTSAEFSFGLGRALLTPDGTLQTAVVRDAAVTAGLLRSARAGDPRVSLPGTQALLLEHIRATAAAGNWNLAARLVQTASARLPGPEMVSAAGGRVVLSIAHSLISAASGRLMPGQIVELQLRALLPHLEPPAVSGTQSAQPQPQPQLPRFADADDMACALCTLARWMLKAGAAALHHHTSAAALQSPHPSHLQPHGNQRLPGADQGRQPYGQAAQGGRPVGFVSHHPQQHHQAQRARCAPQQAPPGFAKDKAVSQASPGMMTAALPWLSAADWPTLSNCLLRQLVAEHAAAVTASAPNVGGTAPAAQLAFLLPEVLLQSCYAPAACYLRALQLSPGLARAWKAWGDLVFRATKEHRLRVAKPPAPSSGGGLPGSTVGLSSGAVAVDGAASSTPSNDASGTWAAVGYGAAAVAYCRYLRLSFSHDTAARPEDVLPVLLQLLHIVVRHATPIEQLLEAQLAAVPPPAWSTITPQLLAQLPGASGAARRLLGLMLHAVGRAAPSLVLYPAVVEVRAADAAAAAAAAASMGDSVDASSAVAMESAASGVSCASMVPELRALLADLGRGRPGLLAGVEMLVGEMERLTVLWDERWAALLTEVEVEIARRAVSLQAEAARVADDASLAADQRQALLSSRYSTLMAPAVMLLERQLRVTAAMPPETPHERRFAAAVLPRLRAAAVSLRDGVGVRDWARPSQAWAPLRAAAAALARQQRQPLPPMAELSPRLAGLQGSEVPMPGCHADEGAGGALVPWGASSQLAARSRDGAAAFAFLGGATGSAGVAATVTVAGVHSELVALNTKTRPKRVALLGSDGQTYAYLLKGREDLRMDERLMQVLRAINVMLQADPAAAPRGLATVRCYSVTPLGSRAGLIQWVPSTTSLFGVFRQWQAATLERHAAMVAAQQEGVAKALAEGASPPPEVEPPPPAAVSRPMDLFYSMLISALQERGLSSATPRRNWPADLLRAVFASLAATAPRQLLARVLWACGGSAALSWRRQQRYSRSLAVMSCVGHLLGLGDRHLDNILLEGREAGVVHIDYNVCWDKGAKLRVPEVVPFRLTQMLSAALGVGGMDGTFRAACEATFACLRRRREALVGLADAVLSDPGVDWAVEREDMAARQDMELAVALNLFVSRAEEARWQLQQVEEDLPAVLEGPVGVLLAYVEAQAFAEAMRNAATEAQQRIQQAKSDLETARRAEAEAGAIVTAAAQEAASLAAEGGTLSNAVPQLLQQCGAWAQQHAGTLGVLRDGSFLEGTLASGASWRAVDSGCALGLLTQVQGPGHAPLIAAAPLALLPAVMGGDGSAISQLPEDLLMSCHECDRQAADLLGRREAALCDAVAALTQYGTIVRKLLLPDYPASSYHHRWAQALSALVAGGLSVPAVGQAQALAPQEPRPLDVAAAWQALRGAQRLAAAAAVVLAPGSPDAAAAMSGHVAGPRVSGRELAGVVVAAGRALGDALMGLTADAQAQAQERLAAAAATPAGRAANLVGFSVHQLARRVAELLQRHIPTPQQLPALGAPAGDGSSGGGVSDAASVGAASAVLMKLVGAASGIMGALKIGAGQLRLSDSQSAASNAKEPASDSAACLQEFLRLSGVIAGLAAAAAALAKTRLSASVLGTASHGLGLSRSRGCSSQSLTQYHHLKPQQGGSSHAISRAVTPGLHGEMEALAACPLPWLSAAAEACSRWPELMQRLAADVAPELAGQLHLGSGGTGGAGGTGGSAPAAPPDTPYAQAAADLHALLLPVEEALLAGRDAHVRLEALAELTATYHDRRADLLRRLAGGAISGAAVATVPLTASERESLEEDLQALDAAWASRDAVAASLSVSAASAADALAETLRRFYGMVLGPGRLPAELQAHEMAAAGYAGPASLDGLAEGGCSGHAGLAALTAWWDAVAQALEGIRSYSDGEMGTAGAGAGSPVPAGTFFGIPPSLRPLWRCGEVAHLVEQSLRVCGQVVRLTAPAGTDGALAEAYGAVFQALVRQAAEFFCSRLQPHLRHYLTGMESHLAALLEHGKDAQLSQRTGYGSGGGMGASAISAKAGEVGGGGGGGDYATDVALSAGTPELVPFTDFDPGAAGEGEVLGALEDEDNEAGRELIDGDGDGVAWLGYNDEPEGGVNDGGASGDDADGYDLDLGLDLDLDDGFGGGSEGLEEERNSFGGASQAEGSGGEGGSDVGARISGRAPAPGTPLPPASPEEVKTLLECLAACATAAAVASAAAAIDLSSAAGKLPAAPAAATWAAGPEARASRAARLQRLAAYEWMHEHHLLQALPAGDPRVGQALAQFFAAQAADPLQPSVRVTAPSRLALLTQLQAALDALPQLEQGVSGWEAASSGAVSQAVALLRGSPERFPVDTALASQRAGMLMGRRQQWLAESHMVVMRVYQVAEALLQFEYSRQGITWSSGAAPVADGFAAHCQLLGRAEVLATLAAAGSEAGRAAAVAEASQRAAVAARQAADARYALEVAQYEEVAASLQLQAHLPLLVSRSLELGLAVAEAEPAAKGLVQLLSAKLGPALEELSSVTAQHSAASDVASVAATVIGHFDRSRQAAGALAEALPAVLAALAAADAAAPLPAEMATEVGFLSAQLLGGPAAATTTRERAMALLQHMAAPTSALQPVVHTVLELPRALGQLNNELSILAAAAGSIAAAVESKHLLPALDEQQQQQQGQSEAQAVPQMPSARTSESAHGQDGTPEDGLAAGTSPLEGTPQAVPAASGLGSMAPTTAVPAAKAMPSGPSGLVRLPLQRLAHAASADHVQHHRSRRSAADEARRRAYAAGALRRFVAKLEGREGDGSLSGMAPGVMASTAQQQPQHLSVSDQMDLLVRQATSVDRLSQMYEGWAAWL